MWWFVWWPAASVFQSAGGGSKGHPAAGLMNACVAKEPKAILIGGSGTGGIEHSELEEYVSVAGLLARSSPSTPSPGQTFMKPRIQLSTYQRQV